MSEERCCGLVAHRDHRHGTGPHRICAASPLQDLIGNTGFAQMIWLMVMGDAIDGPRAALVRGGFGGSRRPRAASALHRRRAHGRDLRRRAAIMRWPPALNMLGDVHGGAGEQAVTLYQRCADAGLAMLPAHA